MNPKCNFCGNINLRNKRVQYLYNHDGKFLFVNNVPCEVCEYCGEQYFEAKVRKKAKMEVRVPVEEFLELD